MNAAIAYDTSSHWDPEGVKWVRDLFRRLAAQGRTVFVSSHLMSEMEHTAHQLR